MKRRLWSIGILMLMTLQAVSAQPALNFPAFDGEYQVGKADYHLIDPAREELLTEDPADQRELLVTLYYPTTTAGTEAPYIEGTLRDVLSAGLEIAPETWDMVHTGILQDVPIAEGQFPLLIFSPGAGNLTVYYTSLLSQLASHGYLVAAIWHPYEAEVMVFPDGRVITALEETPPASPEEMRAGIEARLALWVADQRFVQDQMITLNEHDALLQNHLDTSKIGVMGHSFGGAAAAQAAYLDDRFVAAVNMDGTMFGEVSLNGLEQPFMMMQTEDELHPIEPTDADLEMMNMTREQFETMSEAAVVQRMVETSAAGYVFTLRNAEHNTYTTDYLLFAPFFPERFTVDEIGTVENALPIINDYLLAFFDRHVKGIEVAFPEYAEVVFEGN